MRCRERIWLVIFVLLIPASAVCQDNRKALDSLYAELDSLFASESMPPDLFKLADSLLAVDKAGLSSFQLRLGYVSEIVTAGRSFGLDQYGFTPSASYFHRSGFFAQATGFYSSQYDPSWYLTNLSVGYMYTGKSWFTGTVNHDFYLYNDSISNHSFSRSAEVSFLFHLPRFADAGVDYAYLYGEDQASRITAYFNGRFRLKLRGLINAITFMPGMSFQWGNSTIYSWRQPRTALTDLYGIIRNNRLPQISQRDMRRLTYLLETERANAYTFLLRQRSYSDEQISFLANQYYAGSLLTGDAFGFMNYAISLPVVFRSGRFSLLVNYTYNVPRALPGESFTYSPSGFFSTTLSWLLPFSASAKRNR